MSVIGQERTLGILGLIEAGERSCIDYLIAFKLGRAYDNVTMRFLFLLCASVLVASAPGTATPKSVSPNKMIESSDNWGMYFSNMGGHPAMTVFDDGISVRIDKIELPKSIKVKLYLSEVRDDGLPSSEEGERLMQIGPIVEDAVSKNGGLFFGKSDNQLCSLEYRSSS